MFHTLDNKIWSKDTHSGDTNTRLRCTVGGTEAREDDGGGATHGAEEGLCVFVSTVFLSWLSFQQLGRGSASIDRRHIAVM